METPQGKRPGMTPAQAAEVILRNYLKRTILRDDQELVGLRWYRCLYTISTPGRSPDSVFGPRPTHGDPLR